MENKTSGQFEAVSVPLCKEVSLYPYKEAMENKTSWQFEAVSVPLCKEVGHYTICTLAKCHL